MYIHCYGAHDFLETIGISLDFLETINISPDDQNIHVAAPLNLWHPVVQIDVSLCAFVILIGR